MMISTGRRLTHAFRVFGLPMVLLAISVAAPAQELALSFSTTNTALNAGGRAALWLNVLNPSGQPATWEFPESISGRIVTPNAIFTNTLTLRSNGAANLVTIAPDSFARREYGLTLPATAPGTVLIDFVGLDAGRVVLDVLTPPVAFTTPAAQKSTLSRILQDAEPLEEGKPFDPGRFFEQHISPYDPMYFIAGTESPDAKFQISFKYQLLNETGGLAQKAPALKGFYVAYTQTSLWDLSAPSAPFYDTSYKPAFIYSRERVVGREGVDWFRLDLQGGAQHESNGKDDVDSRSLNILFFRPTFVLGRDDDFQLTLQPRVWGYVGDLSDNPDIDDYRGNFDLRTVLGWRRGLQLSALGRMGHDGDNFSAQFDLTYPMMGIFGNFSFFLQAQYFTGYGESLLGYNERSDIFRLGFALYR